MFTFRKYIPNKYIFNIDSVGKCVASKRRIFVFRKLMAFFSLKLEVFIMSLSAFFPAKKCTKTPLNRVLYKEPQCTFISYGNVN